MYKRKKNLDYVLRNLETIQTRSRTLKDIEDDSALMVEILNTEVDTMKIGFEIGDVRLKGNARWFEKQTFCQRLGSREGHFTAPLHSTTRRAIS